MPKYSYETYSDMRGTASNNNDQKKVGYFKLKPGEKALVRFAYATPKEFEIATVHEVRVKDKFRTILCLRSAQEPLDKCPLCAQGTPLKSRFFCKLIHYVQDEKGNIVPMAEVANWPKKYSDTLNARFQEYGDLQDNLFTVTRLGTGTDTTYDIQFANPVKYSESNGFVKDFSAFEGFDLAHHSYAERTKEEIEEFLQSGDFPMKKKEAPKLESSIPQQQVPQSMVKPTVPSDDLVNVMEEPTRVFERPQQQSSTPSDDITFSRPRRTYDIQ